MTTPLNESQCWSLSADTGGTFTDVVGRTPAGHAVRLKVLSSSALRRRVIAVEEAGGRVTLDTGVAGPANLLAGYRLRTLGDASEGAEILGSSVGGEMLELAPRGWLPRPGESCEIVSPEEPPVFAARLLTGTRLRETLPPLELRVATTRGTNALLERKGAATVLFVTAGFADLLEIGTQARPELFALEVRKRTPLAAASVEVSERMAADGSVVRVLDLGALEQVARDQVRLGRRSAAVALLHAYRNPEHEREVAALLRRAGFEHVSSAAELAPLVKLLPRAETAVVDAYLAPIVGGYLSRIASALGGSSVRAMTSAGGLANAAAYRAKDSLLSGPAGGVLGSARAGRRSGVTRLLTFDMGGTSTDVARYDGELEYVFEHRVGDAQLVAPAVAVESVAAGGGSICRFDGTQLKVGPESAGAWPGPACYGAGGPLTITDVNLLLGRVVPDRFGVPIDRDAAERAFAAVLEEIARARGAEMSRDAALEGFVAIADELMAEAMRTISVRRGFDPAEYALLAFGGAGGQHACAVADLLSVRQILVPADAGLLSAVGLASALVERVQERQVLAPLAASRESLDGWLAELAARASDELRAEGIADEAIVVRRRIARLRLAGQESALAVELRPGIEPASSFEAAYREVYGYWPEGRTIELESLRVVVSSRPMHEEPVVAPADRREASPFDHREVFLAGAWQQAALFDRVSLAVGDQLAGPAIVVEAHATTLVPPGWRGWVDGAGGLRLTSSADICSGRRSAGRDRRAQTALGRQGAGRYRPRSETDSAAPLERAEPDPSDPIQLELFTNRFAAIARDMGEMLQRTASSTNVKERLDFSCAVLDARGELVVNAPHIPVHLGALGLCVRRLLESIELSPGDVVVTNHPAFGGSHLPDVTVVTPVFDEASPPPRLLGFVANRAHHAEIGGKRPGSMPPDAVCLAEEGVVLPPLYLARRGESRWEEIEARFAGGPFPSRSVSENLADLAAAVASNRRGARELMALAERHGAETVARFMSALAERAADRARRALARLRPGRRTATEFLDDGAAITVSVEICALEASAECAAMIDFTGTSGVHPGNLNAPPAVVRSAVLYVLRLLVDEPLPLNEGLLRPVELRVPLGCMLNPEFPADPALAPAVVGGNVETSQRVVDTLLKAFGLVACSQGTMNNVLFGNARFGYYETVAGGCGAGPGFEGASAVHSHMTNTRITDPEILELRYPVRLRRFAVRRGSGGGGRWRGGDGVVRELEFLEPVSLSILSQHRTQGPYGGDGGEPGAVGRQALVRASGDVEELSAIDAREAAPGDVLLLETPGGGGWGAVG